MKQRGPKKIWYGIVYLGKSKYKWKSLKTSNRRLADIEYGKLLQQYTGKAPQILTEMPWTDYCEEFRKFSKGNHAKATQAIVNHAIDRFNDVIHISKAAQLTALVLERFKQARKAAGKSPSTINRELGVLKEMANYGMKMGIIPFYDVRDVKNIKVPKNNKEYFEPNQIKKIRESVFDNKGRVMVDLAVYTGFRRSEMAHLTWEDIDFDKNMISVTNKPNFTVKDFEERKIQLHPELKRTLIDWKKQSKHPYVLGGMKPHSLYTKFRRILKKAKLGGSIHSTRHTFITHLVRAVGSDQAKEAAGHSSVRTTEGYSHQKSEVVPVGVLNY